MPNSEMLKQVAEKDGFIAALDQSGGSTPKALKLYGIEENAYSSDEEMFGLIHDMRTRIIQAPAFTGEKVIGAILFERTMDGDIEGTPTATYLWEQCKVVPFLKVDKGLADEELEGNNTLGWQVSRADQVGDKQAALGICPCGHQVGKSCCRDQLHGHEKRDRH